MTSPQASEAPKLSISPNRATAYAAAGTLARSFSSAWMKASEKAGSGWILCIGLQRSSSSSAPPATGVSPRLAADLVEPTAVDRRLANRNLRTALVAGAIALVVFALSFVVGLVY